MSQSNGHSHRPTFADPVAARKAGDLGRATQRARDLLAKEAAKDGLPVELYPRVRVMETREDVARVRALLRAATDPNAVDRYASALVKLSELERTLAGRPLPGTLKPSPDKSDKPSLAAAIRAARESEVEK